MLIIVIFGWQDCGSLSHSLQYMVSIYNHTCPQGFKTYFNKNTPHDIKSSIHVGMYVF